MNSYNAFVQFGGDAYGSFVHPVAAAIPALSASGINTTLLRFENPAYSTYDASVGVAKDAWNAHVFVQNLSNSNDQPVHEHRQFAVAQTAVRPRVIGVKFGV